MSDNTYQPASQYDPPSRLVRPEILPLNGWSRKNAKAFRALTARMSEAELITTLLEDRIRLIEELEATKQARLISRILDIM